MVRIRRHRKHMGTRGKPTTLQGTDLGLLETSLESEPWKTISMGLLEST
jgi:hypothetical protein